VSAFDSRALPPEGLLRDALSVYKAIVLPLRKARVLLKCMELLWNDGNANDGETCWDAEYLGEFLHSGTLGMTPLPL
jgi:hypothetical protein